MGLRDLQILFSELTLGNIDTVKIAEVRSIDDARALGFDLSKRDVELLCSIDWQVARQGIEAHRRIGDTLSRVRYLRDPTVGAYKGAQYPFPNPKFSSEDNMPESKNIPGAGQPIPIGTLEQPVRYPPHAVPTDPAMYNPAAVRCAPAVDPALYGVGQAL